MLISILTHQAAWGSESARITVMIKNVRGIAVPMDKIAPCIENYTNKRLGSKLKHSFSGPVIIVNNREQESTLEFHTKKSDKYMRALGSEKYYLSNVIEHGDLSVLDELRGQLSAEYRDSDALLASVAFLTITGSLDLIDQEGGGSEKCLWGISSLAIDEGSPDTAASEEENSARPDGMRDGESTTTNWDNVENIPPKIIKRPAQAGFTIANTKARTSIENGDNLEHLESGTEVKVVGISEDESWYEIERDSDVLYIPSSSVALFSD